MMKSGLIGIVAVLLPATLAAQQAQVFGDYEVHYNVINSHLIPAQVATAYNIQRAGNQALLNITVLRTDPPPALPVHARVHVTVTSMYGQQRAIRMREIRAQDTVYYIGQFRFSNEDRYDFDVSVRPQGQDGEPYTFRFEQRFFVD